jgi:hypothetical protein
MALQAKRMNPDNRAPLRYTEASRFGSTNLQQQKRIERLIEIVGVPFVRYLLYCPRPAHLDEITQIKLAHLRNADLAGNIFDFTLGLKLREDLGSRSSTLAAGLFVANVSDLPKNLGQVHRTILQSCYPLSWFLCGHFIASSYDDFVSRGRVNPHSSQSRRAQRDLSAEEWAHGIVTGDQDAISRLMEASGTITDGPFAVLPPHTITINVMIGHDLDADSRVIRLE